jgi:hypothetical protein
MVIRLLGFFNLHPEFIGIIDAPAMAMVVFRRNDLLSMNIFNNGFIAS